ncbi:hypothetical protein N8J89_20510 [Crossiella sp. CA-258035]|uniref:hypothetical protein n=1 Tax=Crossiella sp. CA-258035 TaxID=2981138 RepID=UPI0024BCBD53|nr:hypothetical protein [Crossiella sp. CA-258035]WHT23367.1 hypothetical protein N8J89_20510 [Crossiella sp. CA-258035]
MPGPVDGVLLAVRARGGGDDLAERGEQAPVAADDLEHGGQEREQPPTRAAAEWASWRTTVACGVRGRGICSGVGVGGEKCAVVGWLISAPVRARAVVGAVNAWRTRHDPLCPEQE